MLEALWDYITKWRKTTSFSPLELVYEKSPIFPTEFEINTLKTAVEVGLDLSVTQKHHLEQLHELDKIRLATLKHIDLLR